MTTVALSIAGFIRSHHVDKERLSWSDPKGVFDLNNIHIATV